MSNDKSFETLIKNYKGIYLGHCSFHPEKSAVTSCTSCHRLLCSEDKRKIEQNINGGFKNLILDYCPICNLVQLKEQQDKFQMALVFSIIFSLFGPILLLFQFISTIIYELCFVWIVPFFIIKIKGQKEKIVDAENEALIYEHLAYNNEIRIPSLQEKDNFSVRDSQNNQILLNPKILECFNCGEHLLKTDEYCSNCGSKT